MRIRLFLATLLCAAGLSAQDDAAFESVRAVFKKRCHACHGPKRQKGKLRLDRKEGLFGADQKDWTVLPGRPEASELLRRLRLSKGEKGAMPPKGSRLTPEQVAAIERWIKAGAQWPSDEESSVEGEKPARSDGPSVPEVSAARAAEEEAALRTLRKRGFLARRIAANSRAVDVDMALSRRVVGDAELRILTGLEDCLVSLRLDGAQLTAKGMATLSRFEQLRRLQLARTPITGGEIAKLGPLPRLHTLNLYGTRFADEDLPKLSGFPALRRVYLWGSRVSVAAAKRFRSENSKLQLDLGVTPPAAPKPTSLKMINARCPITGSKPKSSCVFLYKGNAIGFCCPKCLAMFKKDPEGHVAKIPEWKAPRK